MVNRLIFINLLVSSLCLLASTNVMAQNEARYSSDADKAAWIKAHPEEYGRLGGKSASEVVTVEKKSSPTVEAPVQAKGNVHYTPTISDHDLPAVYKQSVDYQDPLVRERLEGEVRAGHVPTGAAANPSRLKPASVAPQPVAKPSREGMPQDWPVYRDTGDKASDDAAYEDAKTAYLQLHPKALSTGAAQAPATETTTTKARISRKQFDALPKERRDILLAHPEEFEIVDETSNK